MKEFLRVEVLIVLFLGIFAAASFSLATTAPELPSGAPTSLEVRGGKIFQRERCAFCHVTADDAAAPPRVSFPLGYLERVAWQWARNGRDLTRLNGERTADWYLAHLVDPGAVVAGCSMPFFGQLPDEDLEALVAFLQKAASVAPDALPKPAEPMPSVPETRNSYLAGRALYQSYCAGCHGSEGNGAGHIGQLLQPEPRAFTDAAWMSKQNDAYLFRIIAQGKVNTAMPGYDPLLTAEERAWVLFYLRFFADPSARQSMEEGFTPF